MKIILKVLSIILATLLFSFLLGFIIAIINKFFGSNFYWILLIALIVLSIIYLVWAEINTKKELTRKRGLYLNLGKLIFEIHSNEFEEYYQSYLKAENNDQLKKLSPIEALQYFGDKKELFLFIDWRGEGYENEIEEFINSKTDKEISWINVTKLRKRNSTKSLNDGEFILQIFKAIDKDLKEINKKLLFFDLGSDNYNITLSDIPTFKAISKFKTDDIHGTEKFKK